MLLNDAINLVSTHEIITQIDLSFMSQILLCILSVITIK